MNQQQFAELYQLVDSIPFSRSKKNITRDFSDGVMMAELIHHYNPKIVSLHNYPSSNSVTKKIDNWNTLNKKVLKKLGVALTKQQIQQFSNAIPGAIEQLLYFILMKFEKPEDQARLSQRSNEHTHIMYEDNSRIEVQPKGKMVPKVQPQTMKDTEEILELVDKIDRAQLQLVKLQEVNKLKEDVIRNLEKKLEKIIFS